MAIVGSRLPLQLELRQATPSVKRAHVALPDEIARSKAASALA
jgi:hypothetical protein